MAGTWEPYQDRKGKWRFRLRARNGKIVLPPEAYPSKKNVLRAISSIGKLIASGPVVKFL